MTKRERTPDIDAQEMFRPEMRRLKPEEVGLVSVPNTQCVASEPNVQTEITQPTDTTVTAEQPAQGISDRVGVKQQRATLEKYRQTFLRVPKIENRKPEEIPTDVSPSAENREPQTRLRELRGTRPTGRNRPQAGRTADERFGTHREPRTASSGNLRRRHRTVAEIVRPLFHRIQCADSMHSV